MSRETFRERHEQSRAWSPFNYEVYARAIRGETVVGVARGQRVAFDRAGGVSHTPLGGDDRLRVFVDGKRSRGRSEKCLPAHGHVGSHRGP